MPLELQGGVQTPLLTAVAARGFLLQPGRRAATQRAGFACVRAFNLFGMLLGLSERPFPFQEVAGFWMKWKCDPYFG